MAGRKGEYLFRRRGSDNWWVRFQIPPDIAEVCDLKARAEKSLRTSYRALAEIGAADRIREHKWLLFSVRAQTNGKSRFFSTGERKHQYEPGREHYTPEGQRVSRPRLSSFLLQTMEASRPGLTNSSRT
jgi:hypothetical protein